MHAEAAARLSRGHQFPAQQADALVQSAQAASSRRLDRGRGSRSGGGYVDVDQVWAVTDAHDGSPPGRVLDGVGEGLLHDPVDGQLGPWPPRPSPRAGRAGTAARPGRGGRCR